MNKTDIEWFQQQSSIEKTYDIFYKAPVISVWVSVVYVKHKKIVYIKRFIQPVQNNRMTHNELIALISRNRRLQTTAYKFYAMAVYNATITPQEIVLGNCPDYFTEMEQIQDVLFLDTIEYLKDDNELFIVLDCDANHSTTKRNKLHVFNRKTLRKR
jgi:hypothetical protein